MQGTDTERMPLSYHHHHYQGSQFTMNVLCIVYWLILLSQHATLDTKRVKGPCERSIQEVGHAGP